MGGVESSRPSILTRGLAIVALLVVAVIAVRLAFGLIAGVVTAALWIGVLVALEMERIREEMRRQGRG